MGARVGVFPGCLCPSSSRQSSSVALALVALALVNTHTLQSSLLFCRAYRHVVSAKHANFFTHINSVKHRKKVEELLWHKHKNKETGDFITDYSYKSNPQEVGACGIRPRREACLPLFRHFFSHILSFKDSILLGERHDKIQKA